MKSGINNNEYYCKNESFCSLPLIFLPISIMQDWIWYYSYTWECFYALFKNWKFNFVSLLKYKCQKTGNKLRRFTQNLLPVIWRLYFNKLTKLNIQFLNIGMHNIHMYYYYVVHAFLDKWCHWCVIRLMKKNWTMKRFCYIHVLSKSYIYVVIVALFIKFGQKMCIE